MQESDKIVRQAIITSLKRELIKASWWEEAHDDVKTRLGWVVDRIDKAGISFARSYMSLFSWEYERRKLEGSNVTNPMASYFSTLMGMRISEEAYQCGLLPTRAVLNLYDYLEPNDADVAACLMLCHKIEVLEKSGMISMNESELETNPNEMAKIMRLPRRKKAPPIQEETIAWDEENE